MSNTKTIAKNTGWYGLDTVISALVATITSIAIARTLGPSKTGYIVYVSYIAGVVSSLGGLGVAAATRKYMAEFIGRGDEGTARYIFFRTFWMRLVLASLATLSIVVWVLHRADAEYRLASILIALSIWPSMVNAIPAGANAAKEDLAANIPGSIVSAFVYLFAIVASVVFHWGVVGIGAAVLLMRGVDFLVRFFPTIGRVLKWERSHVLPEGLRSRMIAFAWQSVSTMILSLVVWERFEVLLLGDKKICPDISQVAFYSIAFSLGNMLLLSSTIFGGATGATIFAQFGRDKSKLPQLASAAFRYITLASIPLHAVATALAFPALIFLYGAKYREAAMVVTIAPLLCMPKAYLGPIQSVLQSTERQVYVIITMVIAGIVDVGVAWTLIPAHGAVGACIGSGTAQITAVGIMWTIGARKFGIKLPWKLTAKVVVMSTAAALAAHFVTGFLSPLWGIVLGGCTALAVLVTLTYLLRILEPQDQARLSQLTGALPRQLGAFAERFLALLIRAERAPLQEELTRR
jgi:O-antigen/teichoic acid export membrane protein